MLRRSPFPSRSPREASLRDKALLPTGSHRSHADSLLTKLGALYPSEQWALLREVHSNTHAAAAHEVIRRADALAVKLTGHWWEIEGFEVKVSRSDWRRELEDPTKNGPLQAFCSAWWVVVPAPRKLVIPSLDELPNRWGLMEIGTGDPVVIVEPVRRVAEEPTAGFGMELVRRALALGQRGDGTQIAGVPLRFISRVLDRAHVGLVCGHVAPRPLAKREPGLVPCAKCAAGLPGDPEIVEAAIRTADVEEIKRIEQQVARRMAELGLRRVCSCPKRGGDPEACARLSLRSRGLVGDNAERIVKLHPCGCSCHPRREGGAA